MRYLLIFCLLQSVLYAQIPSIPRTAKEGFDLISGLERRPSLMGGPADTSIFTHASSNIDIQYYRCEWTVDPAVRYISGKITCHFKMIGAGSGLAFDLKNGMTCDSVFFHGSKLSFSRPGNDDLAIDLGSSLAAGTIDSLTIYYQGQPNSSGFGSFYQGSHAGVPVMWTLSEPYGAREWWPCKNGLSDKADSIDIIITHPSAYRASSNGDRMAETTSGNTTITQFRHRYPIATYLVAFAVTNYTMDTDSVAIGGRKMPLYLYAYPELRNNYLPTFGVVKNAITKFSELYGDYPFSHEHFSETVFGWGGGMEHQTNIFIGSPWNQLVAHELAHQWFGDKVTCASWAHLWLNEGFASYNQYIFIEHFDSTLKKQHLKSNTDLITSRPDGSVYVSDTANEARLFSGRLTYSKGAYVLHMLRWMLGDTLFFQGIRKYVQDPAVNYGFAVTADFERNMEQVSGRDLKTFFSKWIYGEGYPDYQLSWSMNANQWIRFSLTQTTSHPSVNFYEMPVPIRFVSAARDTTIVVDHRFSGQVFTYRLGFVPDTVMIDPDRWILSKNKISTRVEGNGTVPNDISIYPNPAPDAFFIKLNNPTDPKLLIKIFNASGQLLYQQEESTPGRDELFRVPMRSWPSGVYIIRLSSNRSIDTVRRIVK